MKEKKSAKHSIILSYRDVEDKIIELNGNKVILDTHVAELYQVETKRINEAVKNNPEKFPESYLISLTKEDWENLKSKFSTSSQHGGKRRVSTAFTERGLYMLATILKSPVATQTTLMIIDTFTKLREIKQVFAQIPQSKPESPEQKSLMQQAGNIISELIVPDEDHESEASIELNLALVKFKYSVKKSNKNKK